MCYGISKSALTAQRRGLGSDRRHTNARSTDSRGRSRSLAPLPAVACGLPARVSGGRTRDGAAAALSGRAMPPAVPTPPPFRYDCDDRLTRTPQMKIKMLMVLTPSFLVSACAVDRIEPMSVPLKYAANSKDATLVGTLSCSAISQVQVSDGRTDKTLGERVHESKPLKAEVTTSSDVAAWVQDGVQTMLTQNGFRLGSGPKLDITVDTVHTKESVWHRSSYDARIVFKGQLLSPSGNVCWAETIQGRDG